MPPERNHIMRRTSGKACAASSGFIVSFGERIVDINALRALAPLPRAPVPRPSRPQPRTPHPRWSRRHSRGILFPINVHGSVF